MKSNISYYKQGNLQNQQNVLGKLGYTALNNLSLICNCLCCSTNNCANSASGSAPRSTSVPTGLMVRPFEIFSATYLSTSETYLVGNECGREIAS